MNIIIHYSGTKKMVVYFEIDHRQSTPGFYEFFGTTFSWLPPWFVCYSNGLK